MTPTATTPAARSKRSAASAAATKRAASSRPGRSASPHPSTPRPAHRTPTQRTAPPRRSSGPARPRAATRPAPATPALRRPITVRTLGALRTLPDHSLLDRVVRGRLWIPLLGVLLAGIVAMQVEVLKLNASIGGSVVQAGRLQSQDQRLQGAVSRLSDDQRIEAEAAQMGMSMPAAYTPQFLAGNEQTNLARALRNIHSPDPAGFAAGLSARAATRAAEVQSTSGA